MKQQSRNRYKKTLATKEKRKEFVTNYPPSLDKSKKKHKDIEKDEFDGLLKELLVEKTSVLKRLSKK